MNKIELSYNKTLKLTNVLSLEIEINENANIDREITLMENYIKSKGALPIGPMIQKTKYHINDDGEPVVSIYLMRQSDKFIHNVESPYNMDSIIRIRNCVYVRYTGPEEKIKFAYDKINVDAFENNYELCDENYTIFVNQVDDGVVADIFVGRNSNE